MRRGQGAISAWQQARLRRGVLSAAGVPRALQRVVHKRAHACTRRRNFRPAASATMPPRCCNRTRTCRPRVLSHGAQSCRKLFRLLRQALQLFHHCHSAIASGPSTATPRCHSAINATHAMCAASAWPTMAQAPSGLPGPEDFFTRAEVCAAGGGEGVAGRHKVDVDGHGGAWQGRRLGVDQNRLLLRSNGRFSSDAGRRRRRRRQTRELQRPLGAPSACNQTTIK